MDSLDTIGMSEITDQIASWLEEGFSQLKEAESVCDDANQYITSTTTKLASKDDRLPKLQYYIDSTKQQIRLLKIIRDSLKMKIDQLLKRKKESKAKEEESIIKLDTMITLLKKIRVDSCFNSNRDPLFSYISEDDLNNLLTDADTTIKELDGFAKESRIDANLIRLNSDLENFQNEFTSLESHFTIKEKSNNSVNGEDSISGLLKINENLELDLVSILSGFNQHYDQCIKASKLFADSNSSIDDKNASFMVLKNDKLELPHAMTYLKNDRDTVVMNCKEVLKSVDIFNNYFKRVEDFIDEMSKYGEGQLHQRLDDFNHIITKLGSQLDKVESLTTLIDNYSGDFSQFIDSYYSLILEIQRRKDSNKRLEDIISNFKIKMTDVINDDANQRSSFMKLHGDFLPQNLVAEETLKNGSSHVEVNLVTETLPAPSRETISEANKYKQSLS